MKYIYLDQNKWIELAKGIKDENPMYISLYETIQEKVEKEEWAFPISLIHIIETVKRKNETSKKDLLDLMFSISKGWSICEYMTADSIEFNSWINNKFVEVSELRNKIIRPDWAMIIGIFTEQICYKINDHPCTPEEVDKIKKLTNVHSCDREIFDFICTILSNGVNEDEEDYYQCYNDARKSFQSWKTENKNCEDYREKHLYPAYLIQVFFEVYREKITGLSPEMKENLLELFQKNSKNKTKMIANLETLPGFNVHNRLLFELCNNPDRDVHEHDFNDLAYLRVAIPYCDVVIGEKYWCDRVINYGLDKKYNTIVGTRLLSLNDF